MKPIVGREVQLLDKIHKITSKSMTEFNLDDYQKLYYIDEY